MSHILSVERITQSFGRVTAVNELSLDLKHGEILGVIGPNGAGKTTLFNLIVGQIKPISGKVFFGGEDITHVDTFKRCRMGIARTYQIPRPFLNMTVLENLLVASAFGAGVGSRGARKKCEKILEVTGMLPKSHVFADALSLLDRKRLELARALSTDPKLLLLDEVAGGLTESEVEQILKIINSIREEGTTILWVEHIMMAMKKGPDRLLVMNFGRELLCGRPEEVFSSPEVQKIYLGEEDV